MLRDETLSLLAKFGVDIDPALDEQQLVDPEVIDRLIVSADVGKRDAVFEVGPGCGNITVALAAKAGRVIAVEKNPKFMPILSERMKRLPNVEVILGDALKIRLPRFDKVVSNLPYSICEAFVQRLTHLQFDSAALITSSSFAVRLTAGVDDPMYSKLSFVARTFFSVEVIGEINSSAYHPEPRESTSMMRLKKTQAMSLREAVLRKVLVQRDKKLKNALREALISASPTRGCPSTKRGAKAVVKSTDLGPILEKWVARLSLDDLQRLSDMLQSIE